MRLLIDAGNMRVKWAVASSSVDEVFTSGVLDNDWSDLARFIGKVESAWVSCVAGSRVLDDLTAKVREHFNIALNVVKVSYSVADLTNGYADINRLGVDRWVAALGARALICEGALIVIDAGTAITIDLVSSENRFEGGVILPGFVTMHNALIGRTAGIESKPQPVSSVIGRDTRECINSGVQYGLIGAIERVVAEMCATIGRGSPRLLITGGDAELIVAGSKLEVELQSNIMFHGLMLLSK